MSIMLKYREPDGRLSDFKICLACCSHEELFAGFAISLAGATAELQKRGIEFNVIIYAGHCHVDDSRNAIVAEFLKSDCTHLLFIDSDIRFEFDDLLRLIGRDYEVVGGIYPLKEPEEGYVIKPLKGAEPSEDGLLEVNGIGTGFLKIRRSVIEAIEKEATHYINLREETKEKTRIPIIFERVVEDYKRMGGDIAFCHKWQKLGGKVHADITLDLAHIGVTEWRGIYQVYLKRKNPENLRKEVDLIKAGKETDRDIVVLKKAYGNERYISTEEILLSLILFSRQIKGDILECGCGLSTIVMAAANPENTIYALEQEVTYALWVQSLIDCYSLKNVKILQTPVVDGWYKIPKGLPDFDMVYCDGPRGERSKMYDAVSDKVKKNAIMVFDDYGFRTLEEDLKKWGSNYNIMGGYRKFAVLNKLS